MCVNIFQNHFFRLYIFFINDTYKMKLFLFDVDGTLAESGDILSEDMKRILTRLVTEEIHLGIVGGGVYETICRQIGDVRFDHIFSECGSVYHFRNEFRYLKNIRHHALFPHIQRLMKKTLRFLSEVSYPLSGKMIDLRHGLVYMSLVGMQATMEERKRFQESDDMHQHRKRLLALLQKDIEDYQLTERLHVVEGGAVGISIYPSEWDKVQVMETLLPMGYEEIHYFGDKYGPEGNDFLLLHHPAIWAHPVKSVSDTLQQLIQYSTV